MTLLRNILFTLAALCATMTLSAQTPPDMQRIKAETTNPAAPNYYPRLLEKFMANDTSMTPGEYHDFYYGVVFTEDYNPYRPNPYLDQIKNSEALYLKREHLTRKERREIEDLARKSLANNPLDLRQLMFMVYVLEQNQKYNLAKIWKSKLDNLLLTISRSGTGTDIENARVVVFPRHEFDFFNISGLTVSNQEFIEPYYEKITVQTPAKKDSKELETYYNLRYMLEQYWAKHPSEFQNAD